jgi:hypothetical protein
MREIISCVANFKCTFCRFFFCWAKRRTPAATGALYCAQPAQGEAGLIVILHISVKEFILYLHIFKGSDRPD